MPKTPPIPDLPQTQETDQKKQSLHTHTHRGCLALIEELIRQVDQNINDLKRAQDG